MRASWLGIFAFGVACRAPAVLVGCGSDNATPAALHKRTPAGPKVAPPFSPFATPAALETYLEPHIPDVPRPTSGPPYSPRRPDGTLTATRPSPDGCREHCPAWFANAQAFPAEHDITAVLGYEIVRATIDHDRIEETDRLDLLGSLGT